MAGTNDVTGDRLVSFGYSEKGRDQFDIIFGRKKTQSELREEIVKKEDDCNTNSTSTHGSVCTQDQ